MILYSITKTVLPGKYPIVFKLLVRKILRQLKQRTSTDIDFHLYIEVNFKIFQKTEKILYTPLFFQLFAHFQIIVNTTLYCRKNNIKISPFGIFNIRNYQISTTQQLLKTYSLITQTPFPDATAEKKFISQSQLLF